jgi:hypothetical protein
MKIHAAALAAGLLTLSVAVSAQASDTSYCTELSHSYTKYVADPNAARNPMQPPADVGAAQAKCDSDPASAIPILEKALSDKKISLPAR